MVTRLNVTPWRDHEELLLVRKELFWSRNGKDLDHRRKACSHVSMWKRRGNLPHKIESTAFLTDAVLHDDAAVNSTFAIRAVYSAAFCRFVTGLVDSNLGARHRPTMYAKAKAIGLPASFVELRHRATHNDLPSLVVLRQAAQQSLQWLWKNYWQLIDIRTSGLDEDAIDEANGGREQLRQRCRDILLTYVRSHEAASKGTYGAGKRNGMDTSLDSAHNLDSAESSPEEEARKAADGEKRTEALSDSEEHHKTEAEQLTFTELQVICHNHRPTIRLLVEVLLDGKLVIPQARLVGANMDGCFDLWDMLLRKLADSQSEFLVSLTDAMLIRIIDESSLDANLDPYREALAAWLGHIYTSHTWSSSFARSKVSVNTAMSTCLQNPNRWTLQFGWVIINSPFHKTARARYETRLKEASRAYKQGDVHGIKGQSPAGAWHQWEGYWAPTPIGMVPSI